jgi:vanillate/3-O-methylgallate O-demethylase
MTIAKSPFARPGASPFYPAYGLYLVSVGPPRQWEFNGWKPESMSWKTGCYIHAGLSGPGQFVYRGTEAEKFLSSICVNNFSNFAVGAAKHSIMCNDDGLTAGHGLRQLLVSGRGTYFNRQP